MEIAIHGHNMEVTPRLTNYIEKKTGKLDRYMPDLKSIEVELSEENTRSASERQIAQITIRDTRGTILRAEERSSDMFAAIDTVIDKLYRQIDRYRGKRKRKWRGAGAPAPEEFLGEPLPIEEEEDLGPAEPHIARRKRFASQPMSTEEAIDQMELLGHDFFVFFNVADAAINVLYKRRDGNFGILQPEMD